MATFTEIITSKPLVLVDFYATWCGPCQTMQPVLTKIKQSLGNSITILKVDTDKAQEAASAYRIQGVPTFILFHNGQQVWRQSGALPEHQLMQTLQPYLHD